MRHTIANVWLVWLVVCVQLELVKAKPVSTEEKENSDQQTDEFAIGEPLTQKEFASNITVREGEIESEDFIPWDKQDPGLFGGDMKLSGGKTGIVSLKERWPDALIPYTISASYTPRQREIIASAMNALHQNTCIRFVPRTSEKDYVRIIKTGGGCWSEVGMIGLRQILSLDDRCILASIPGLVVHELMHTLGFYHEHQRPDRDEFVSINLKNVEPKNRGYFQKMSEWDFLTLKFSYDYGSVTHYPSNAFAKDSKIPVILKLKGKNPYIANRKAVSPVDVEKLNDWYCGASDDYLF